MDSYPKLERVEFLGRYVIRGHLTDGTVRELDFEPYLYGPLFGPLADPQRFHEASVDDTGTLSWPNGADVAPEAWVHGFPEETRAANAS